MTSKVQAHCMKVAAAKGHTTLAAELALIANVEPGSHGGVFLDNAYDDVSHLMTRAQWSGCLSQLQQAGKYEPSQDAEYRGRYGYYKG